MTFQRLTDADGQSGQGSHDDASSDAPPAYDSIASHSKGSNESHAQVQQQGTAPTVTKDIWKKCMRDHGWGCLGFWMVPDPNAPDYQKASWAALLDVNCDSVPRLMREGFFWSADNVLPEEGYIAKTSIPIMADRGFHSSRTWILADKSNGETPKWVGHLQVMSPSPGVLGRFRLQDLSRHNVCIAAAWNALDNTVYTYNCRIPEVNFNSIYDGKPLQGWWPWPRKEGTAFPPAPRASWDLWDWTTGPFEDELFNTHVRVPLTFRESIRQRCRSACVIM